MKAEQAVFRVESVTGSSCGGNGEGVSLPKDLAGHTLQQGQGAFRTLIAMPAYNEEVYIAKIIVDARHDADAARCRRWVRGCDSPDR